MIQHVPPSTLKGGSPPGSEGVPPSALEEIAPNPTTRKAMDELEQGKGKGFDSADELFEDLGI